MGRTPVNTQKFRVSSEAAGVPAAPDSAVSYFPVRLWTEFVILALGLPAAIWVASKLIKLSIPAATHGSPGERFLWWITGGAIAECLFVLGVVFVLRHRQLSLKVIGVWRVGNWPAWVFALFFAALSIGKNPYSVWRAGFYACRRVRSHVFSWVLGNVHH